MKRHFDHKGKRIIREEIRINATPEQVWQAWADPAKIAHWFPDKAEGDVRPGGHYKMVWERFGVSFSYDVVEAIPGEQLVLGGQGPGGAFLLDITIEKEEGQTLLRIVNSGFREDADFEDEYLGTVTGWTRMLHLLKHYLEHYAGRPKSQFLVLRPAKFRFEQVKPYFQTADGLRQWLTESGDFGSLVLRDGGGTVTGPVLAFARHETLIEWKEIEGVLQLTAFAHGGNYMLSVNGFSWAGRGPELEPGFTKALERLAALLG